ncbi:PQQ-binding-like beta-propeller repeat protein [Flindersiella endophytica]
MSRRWKVLLIAALIVCVSGGSIVVARLMADSVVRPPPAGSPAGEVLAWATDDLVVSTAKGAGQIVAQTKSDGSVRWTYDLPDGVICAASRGVLNGAVALAYGADGARQDSCEGLLLLDLGSGEPRWDVTPPGDLSAVEVAGGHVVGALRNYDRQNIDVVAGFDAAAGDRRWAYESECHGMKLRTSDDGFVGGRERIAFAGRCGAGAYQPNEVRMLDAVTGRLIYSLQLQSQDSDAQILSAAPLVVYQTVADPTGAPESGSVQGLVQVVDGVPGAWSPTYFRVKAHPGQRIGDRSDVIDHRFMVVTTEAGGWATWDLNGGKDHWRRARITAEVDGDQATASGLVRTSGKGVLVTAATRAGKSGKPGKMAVLRLNPLTGEGTPLSHLLDIDPAQPGTWLADGRRAYVVTGPGRVAAHRIS